MQFLKYHHVEKLGHMEVAGLLDGQVHVYPKLDGTNASLWWSEDDKRVMAGSRKRVLASDNDNQGFHAWVGQQENLFKFFSANPNLRLYGEWLVPHSLKTYREEAWRRFWVFDVYDHNYDKLFPVEEYANQFEEYGIDYIMPLAVINFPTEDQLIGIMKNTNTFLIADGKGVGEGIVLKRYQGWTNEFGNQCWGKLVRNEFKEMNKRAFGIKVTDGQWIIEQAIVDEYVTEAFVRKELHKIVQLYYEMGSFECSTRKPEEMETYFNSVMVTNRGKIIPRLLSTVFHTLLVEETKRFVKQYKNPTIDFKRLARLTEAKVKVSVPELF